MLCWQSDSTWPKNQSWNHECVGEILKNTHKKTEKKIYKKIAVHCMVPKFHLATHIFWGSMIWRPADEHCSSAGCQFIEALKSPNTNSASDTHLGQTPAAVAFFAINWWIYKIFSLWFNQTYCLVGKCFIQKYGCGIFKRISYEIWLIIGNIAIKIGGYMYSNFCFLHERNKTLLLAVYHWIHIRCTVSCNIMKSDRSFSNWMTKKRLCW